MKRVKISAHIIVGESTLRSAHWAGGMFSRERLTTLDDAMNQTSPEKTPPVFSYRLMRRFNSPVVKIDRVRTKGPTVQPRIFCTGADVL